MGLFKCNYILFLFFRFNLNKNIPFNFFIFIFLQYLFRNEIVYVFVVIKLNYVIHTEKKIKRIKIYMSDGDRRIVQKL